MPIPDLTTWKADLAAPYQKLPLLKQGSLSAASDVWCSMWTVGPFAGAAPAAAAVPTRATAGAWQDFLNGAGGGVQRLARLNILYQPGGYLMLCDRLSHQGGLSGTVTTAQTTNLPTAALTRYTTGEGVWMALEIYTGIGATATTVTVSYTNQAGTAGRTSVATTFGGAGFQNAGRVILLPLQAGDTGVRSVQSVTVLASTLTAGNFGVTLFKPIVGFPVILQKSPMVLDMLLDLFVAPQIQTDACLFWLAVPNTGANNGPLVGEGLFVEE